MAELHSHYRGSLFPRARNASMEGIPAAADYGDVFGGPPKFSGAAPMTDEYGEIFGGFAARKGGGVGIPFLELPELEEDEGLGGSGVDYGEVFGCRGSGRFAIDFRRVLTEQKSDDRPVVGTENPHIPTVLFDDCNGSSSASERDTFSPNEQSPHIQDGTQQFNVSYNKSSYGIQGDMPNGATHVTELNQIPGFAFVVKSSFDSKMASSEATLNEEHIDLGCKMPEKDVRSETSSQVPLHNNALKDSKFNIQGKEDVQLATGFSEKTKHVEQACNLASEEDSNFMEFKFGIPASDHSLPINVPLSSDGDKSILQKVFITVSDINLRTRPSRIPPPARAPPKLQPMQVKESIEKLSSGSPSYVEVDAKSHAAASAAVMREAMEKAQAKLKSARESMEKRRLNSRYHYQSSLNQDQRRASKQLNEDKLLKMNDAHQVYEHGLRISEIDGSETGRATNRASTVSNSAEKVPLKDLSGNILKPLVERCGKESEENSLSCNLSDQTEEMKVDEHFYELVNNETKQNFVYSAEQGIEHQKSANNNVQMLSSKDEKEREQAMLFSGRYKRVVEFEENISENKYQTASDTEKHNKVQAGEGNNERAALNCHEEKMPKEVQESNVEIEKKKKAAFELEGEEKGLEAAHNSNEREKRMKLALYHEEEEKRLRTAHEREEEKKRLRDVCEREEEEKRLRAAREEEDKRLRAAREEKEKRLREAREEEEKRMNAAQEEKEKRLRAREEEEKRLKAAQEEKQKRLKAAQEEKEKKLRAAREEEEKRLKAAQEEKEKRLMAAREVEQKRLKAAQEEKEKGLVAAGEEEKKKLRAALEEKEKKLRAAREEEQKRLKAAQEEKEKRLRAAGEEEQIRLKAAQEEKEKRLRAAREEEQIKLKAALERKEEEARLEAAREREEEEKRLKAAHEREEGERKLRAARQREEEERRLRVAREREEEGRRQRVVCEQQEEEKRLKESLDCAEGNQRASAVHESVQKRLNARDHEEEEKRQKTACECEKVEIQTKSSCETEEEGNSSKPACSSEKQEKTERAEHEEDMSRKLATGYKDQDEKLISVIQREQKEMQVKEAFVYEDNENRPESICEREDEQPRLPKTRVHEEDETKLQKDYEHAAEEKGFQVSDEHNQVPGTSKEVCEHEEAGKNLKVAFEQEEGGKQLNASCELVDGKRELKPANECEDEKRPKEASELDENVMRREAACEHEEQNRPKIVYERRKDESKKVDEECAEDDGRVELRGHSLPVLKKNGNSVKNDVQANGTLKNNETETEEVEVTHESTKFEKKGTMMSGQKVVSNDSVTASDVFSMAVNEGKSGAPGINREVDDQRDKEDQKQRERNLEVERLRALEEERERQKERKKDRIAVENVIRESRDRAYAQAKDRAERAAAEKTAAESRQRALTEARERAERIASAEKAATDSARLRAERAAVERVTFEARQRALDKVIAAVKDKPDYASGQNTLSSDDRSFHASTSETAQRCKARLERHQRTAQRAAKALAEKNMRDILAQREQSERNRFADTLDADIRRWSNGKEGNLRALLSTLQYILGPESGWQPVSLTEVITAVAVKKVYRKATLCVHPDKVQQRGASVQQKYICEKVFDLIKDAWNKFNSEER